MTQGIAFHPMALRHAQTIIQAVAGKYQTHRAQELKLQILEAASARIGGFNLDWYWRHQSIKCPNRNLVDETSERVVSEISRSNVHPAMCLATLATPSFANIERRKSGSYFTDSRLAEYVVHNLDADLLRWRPIIDPACGSGILLVASVLWLATYDRKKISRLLESCVVGIDKNPVAVRAAALSLSALTSDKAVIIALLKNLIVADSAIAAADLKAKLAPSGFGAVVTNPPWEKLKITRHEYLSAAGVVRHYGDDYTHRFDDRFAREVEKAKDYAELLASRYKLAGKEIDLYSVFVELCLELSASGGQIAILVPAGFIRSQGMQGLRARFLHLCSTSKISVFENRARFFEIDTRFKFLTIYGRKGAMRRSHSIELTHPTANESGIAEGQKVTLPVKSIAQIRRDLTIPEVRDRTEWILFQKIARRNPSLNEWGNAFRMSFMREVDMTRDRILFERRATNRALPLIEGRMVHQYTCCAKRYISGTGRRAKWASASDTTSLHPQFWIAPEKLPAPVLRRMGHSRIGFCDITGQSNERSMLAAFVPRNAVCGNKVPTIAFPTNSDNLTLGSMLLAVANSFVFDWLLRRVLTTTVNYFILESVPYPKIDVRSPLATRLTQLAQNLCSRHPSFGRWEEAEIRAEIEALILRAYNLTVVELELMFKDFPLLDRSEPPLPGEKRSTVTRDFTLLKCAKSLRQTTPQVDQWEKRVYEARMLGATPYRPSHLVKDEIDEFSAEIAEAD